jgi:RHS repeat-associated protein
MWPNVQASANELRFAYTGREWDGETGQYYYRARYYDPADGRFISEDPIRFRGNDTNLNRHVGNSPTNFIDPSGLQLTEVAPPPPAPVTAAAAGAGAGGLLLLTLTTITTPIGVQIKKDGHATSAIVSSKMIPGASCGVIPEVKIL